MAVYLHERHNWTEFQWEDEKILKLLSEVQHIHAKLIGKIELLGLELKDELNLKILIQDVVKSSEIEGEVLNLVQVRSSIATRLGLDNSSLLNSDRYIDSVVEMMLDATQYADKSISTERLFSWHGSLFPTRRSGLYKINVAQWRTGDMHVLSGGIGREIVHFEAPKAHRLNEEMNKFINWFNSESAIDTVLKAAIVHLWFVTIHPFDDGNGRIARALTDMQLSKVDGVNQRFYSMSAQIKKEHNEYYKILEKTQKGDSDITNWIVWFLNCLKEAIIDSNTIIDKVVRKNHFWMQNNAHISNDRQRIILNKLMDNFEGKLTSSKWAKITKVSKDTALSDITDLVNKSVLVRADSSGRTTNYVLNW